MAAIAHGSSRRFSTTSTSYGSFAFSFSVSVLFFVTVTTFVGEFLSFAIGLICTWSQSRLIRSLARASVVRFVVCSGCRSLRPFLINIVCLLRRYSLRQKEITPQEYIREYDERAQLMLKAMSASAVAPPDTCLRLYEKGIVQPGQDPNADDLQVGVRLRWCPAPRLTAHTIHVHHNPPSRTRRQRCWCVCCCTSFRFFLRDVIVLPPRETTDPDQRRTGA